MKKFSMVVHSSQQQELADILRGLHLDCFMFNHIEEHGAQNENDAALSARDKVVGYVPKVRLDVIVDDDRTEALIDEIRNSTFSCTGKNVYWIIDLEVSGRL